MEIDTTPPSGTGAAPAPSLSYGDARREILDALAAAMATVHSAQRAPEKLVREQLERRLAKVLPPEPESATPETAQRPAEGDVAGLERTRAAELRKLLDSQGWRIEVGKVLENFDESNFDRVYNVLDAILVASELGYSDHNTPLLLIEEIMDCLTIQGTEKVFDYMELRHERLTDKMIPNKGKGLTLLRLCNELLRRLSRTQNTVYSGRILMYLSTAYPLSERSGVNLRGDFNKDNVTHFEGEDIEDVEPEEGRTELSDAEKEARFYCQFWGMQRFFSNPPTLFVEGNLEKLRLATEATLTRFEAISGGELPAGPTPSGSQSGNSSSSRESASASMVASRKRKQRPDDKALGKEETFYFPKFLTSPKLFDLELRDPNFRRHILLQILIVSQYLLLQSPKERERLTEYLAATKNGTGAPKAGAGGAPKAGPGAPKTLPAAGFTLAEQEIRWLDQLRVRCTKTLELLPGNGRAFMKTILGTLSQEKAWIKWKLESCNSFERPGLPLDLQMHSKRRKAEQLPAFLKKDAWLAANAPAKDPLARLKDPLRNPTLEGYMDEIREDLTEYEDREERRASDPRTQWKVWRLVRQGGMPAFYRMAAGNKEKSKEKEKAEREKAEKDKAAKEKAKSEPVKDGGEASGTATPVAEAQPVGKDIGEDGEKPKEQEAPGYPDLEEFLAEWDRENGKQRLASVKMEVDKS